MLPDISRMESQHNVVFCNACLHEVIGNPLLCAIALNPQFAINNVNMEKATVDPFVVFPTKRHQRITVRRAIKYRFKLNMPVGI